MNRLLSGLALLALASAAHAAPGITSEAGWSGYVNIGAGGGRVAGESEDHYAAMVELTYHF